jgi:ATP-dependent exoDNAse (exonuclease V) beta subunit
MSKTAAQSLSPDQPQRNQALDSARSILVQAPAGSGKTDLLTRRFLRLLAEVEEPGQVVAITFTNAAAAEMRHRILGELEKAATRAGAATTAAEKDAHVSGHDFNRQGERKYSSGLAEVSGHDFSHAVTQAKSTRALAPEGSPPGNLPALAPDSATTTADEFSMDALASRALEHSQALGWKLLDLPAQLRISTIDSFCRDLALQQPLLSGLGGGLAIAEQPAELYRRAARQTLNEMDQDDPTLGEAIAALLNWRDNNWQEMEDLLVKMLQSRDRWMHGFVLEREQDWETLRLRLERPFANAAREALAKLDQLFSQIPQAREEALALARFACTQSGGQLHRELAELAEFPSGSSPSGDALEEARDAYLGLATLLLTGGGTLRKSVDKRLGFPADRKREKQQILDLIAALSAVPDLESSLAAVRSLPPTRYTEEDWLIVRACFTLLRRAAAQLKVAFAEAGQVDFIEVAQIAQSVLKGADGLPTDAALAVSDGIRHLLVDEFQDTSRRQHQLLAGLIAAWPERAGRTCFLVGDPMQSIYFFREADAELFPRVKEVGLEIPPEDPLLFEFVPLAANFRTTPALVNRLNEVFVKIFAADDGSGVTFSPALPAREGKADPNPPFSLHLEFVPQTGPGKIADPNASSEKESAQAVQIKEIITLIENHRDRIEQARASGEKYRIAVLARARKSLTPIAQALREARIPFHAVELEKLSARPEVLDALALARALLNPQDRVAWLGVLRAPWCGLALDDLHRLTSADEPALLARPVPELLAERLPLLSAEGRVATQRVLDALTSAPSLRAAQPSARPGTWLEQIWMLLGGAACVDAAARANLDLLWSCLDRLPNGEQDLLGPALDAALDKLTALPDPQASSDCGVQLMTIHKSKGLEFEVVIVPDLQAGTKGGERKMLSWLERGLAQPDESGEITEFLVAPLQTKGAEGGAAKKWVDRVYRNRESQEDRRILYVASTRAREELYLFARPACKIESNGEFSLPSPSASLLATAWPAFEEEVRARFENWKAARTKLAAGEEQVIESIAASGDSNLLVMPTPARPTLLRRLPPNYQPTAVVNPESDASQMLRAPSFPPGAPSFPRLFAERVGDHISSGAPEPVLSLSKDLAFETWETTLYPRHEGGLLSRAFGVAVHTLLEELARLRTINDWNAARAALVRFKPRIAAQVRASGIEPTHAARIASQALESALNASRSPQGQWILSPHAEAASELRWAGVVAGSLRTVRVDRIFRAGPAPESEGDDCWWIIDYKTAHADNLDPAAALPELRKLFALQLEAYATILRNLRGNDAPIRAGLYYPRMLLFDWWQL